MRINQQQPKSEDFAYSRLLAYCRLHWPDYKIAKFHILIAHYLQEVEKGNVTRLIISMPPRHGKTMLVTYFMAWFLGRNPKKEIIYTSYSQERADDTGAACRNLMLSEAHTRAFPNGTLAPESKASRKFLTIQNGKFYAAGWGSSVTGRGAHILVADDMVKDRVDDRSELSNRKRIEWFTSTAYTRLMPDDKQTGQKSAIIAIGTRWSYNDFLSYLEKELSHENWVVLAFPAICDSEDDLIQRTIGEPLWPGVVGHKQLSMIQKTLSSLDWSALMQQRPLPVDGGMLPISWIQRYSASKMMIMKELLQNNKELPSILKYFNKIVISIDCAAKTNTTSDYTAICVFGYSTEDNNHYLIHSLFKKLEFPELIRTIQKVHKEYEGWKLGSPLVLIEDKSSGTSAIQHLRSTTRIPIVPIVPHKSKALRLENVLPQIESGRLWFPNKAHWLYAVEEQISQFPLGKNDDIVDAISQYLNYKFGKRTRRSAVSRYIR